MADTGNRIPWSLQNILTVCIAFYKYVFINSTYVQVNKGYIGDASGPTRAGREEPPEIREFGPHRGTRGRPPRSLEHVRPVA